MIDRPESRDSNKSDNPYNSGKGKGRASRDFLMPAERSSLLSVPEKRSSSRSRGPHVRPDRLMSGGKDGGNPHLPSPPRQDLPTLLIIPPIDKSLGDTESITSATSVISDASAFSRQSRSSFDDPEGDRDHGNSGEIAGPSLKDIMPGNSGTSTAHEDNRHGTFGDTLPDVENNRSGILHEDNRRGKFGDTLPDAENNRSGILHENNKRVRFIDILPDLKNNRSIILHEAAADEKTRVPVESLQLDFPLSKTNAVVPIDNEKEGGKAEKEGWAKKVTFHWLGRKEKGVGKGSKEVADESASGSGDKVSKFLGKYTLRLGSKASRSKEADEDSDYGSGSETSKFEGYRSTFSKYKEVDEDSGYGSDKDGHGKERQQEVFNSYAEELQETVFNSYIKNIHTKVFTLVQNMMEDINWPRSRKAGLDKFSGLDSNEERKDDTFKGKLMNRIQHEFRNDLLGRVKYVSNYKEFDEAEIAVLNGNRTHAIHRLTDLLSKLRRREVAYDFQPGRHAEDSEANRVSRDGKIEIIEVSINGKQLAPRQLSFDHIKNIAQTVIQDGQNTHPVNAYTMHEADSRREKHAVQKAQKEGKGTESPEYKAALYSGRTEYDNIQKDAENATRKYACLEKSIDEIEAIASKGSEKYDRKRVSSYDNLGDCLNDLESRYKNILTMADRIYEKNVDVENGGDRKIIRSLVKNMQKKVDTINAEYKKHLSKPAAKQPAVKQPTIEEIKDEMSKRLKGLVDKGQVSKEAEKTVRGEIATNYIKINIESLKDVYEMLEAGPDKYKELAARAQDLEEVGKKYSEELAQYVIDPIEDSYDGEAFKEKVLTSLKEDLKGEMEEIAKRLKKVDENVIQAVTKFSEMRNEDIFVTRLVTRARVAHYDAQIAEQELRRADKRVADANPEQSTSEDARSRVEKRKKIQAETKRNYDWWSGYSNRAWKNLHGKKQQESADITMEDVKKEYREDNLLYAARRNGKIELYHLKQESGDPVYTGIEIPLDKIAVGDGNGDGKGKTGTNEKGEFVIHFIDEDGTEATGLTISKLDDLDVARRRVGTDLLDTNVQGMRAQIEGVLKILEARDTTFDEDAVKLSLAAIRQHDAFLEKTLALLSAPKAPQADATRWQQIFNADRLKVLSHDEIEERHSQNILGMLGPLNERREEFLQGVKELAKVAINQGAATIIPGEMANENPFGYSLKRNNASLTIRDFNLYTQAGMFLEHVTFVEDHLSQQDHLSEILKKSSSEARSKIMLGSITDAYLKNVNKSSELCQLAIEKAIHQYGIEDNRASDMAEAAEKVIEDSYSRWARESLFKGQIDGNDNITGNNRVLYHECKSIFLQMAEMLWKPETPRHDVEAMTSRSFSRILKREDLPALVPGDMDKILKDIMNAPVNGGETIGSILKNHKWEETALRAHAKEIIKLVSNEQEEPQPGLRNRVFKTFWEHRDDNSESTVYEVFRKYNVLYNDEEGLADLWGQIDEDHDKVHKKVLSIRIPSEDSGASEEVFGEYMRKKGLSDEDISSLFNDASKVYFRSEMYEKTEKMINAITDVFSEKIDRDLSKKLADIYSKNLSQLEDFWKNIETIEQRGYDPKLAAKIAEYVAEERGTKNPERTLTEHLKTVLKESSGEVRSKIMQQSALEAHFKHGDSADRRKAVCDALLRYDVYGWSAEPIADKLEEVINERFKSWSTKEITPGPNGPAYRIEECLKHLSPLKRRETFNHAAIAYFQNDFDPITRKNAMQEALFKDIDAKRANLVPAMVEEMIKEFQPQIHIHAGLDVLRYHRWSEEVYQRKAQEIITSAAETSQYIIGDSWIRFYMEQRHELSLSAIVHSLSAQMYRQGTGDYNQCKAVIEEHIASLERFFRNATSTPLHRENYTGPSFFIKNYLAGKQIALKDFAQALIKIYNLPPSPMRNVFITETFKALSTRISPNDTRNMARILGQETNKMKGNLWHILHAKYVHIYQYDKNMLDRYRTDSDIMLKDLKFSFSASPHDRFTQIETYLEHEAGRAYNRYDSLNILWKNKILLDHLYQGSLVKSFNPRSIKGLETLKEDVLDNISNEQERKLLRGVIRFQNQWVQNLQDTANGLPGETSSVALAKALANMSTVVRHAWHQVLKMDRDLKTVITTLEKNSSKYEKQQILDRIVQKVGKPVKTMEEVYEEALRPLNAKMQALEEKAQKNFSAKGAETAGFIEWVTDLSTLASEIAPLVMRKYLMELHERVSEDEFKARAQTLYSQMPNFMEKFEKFAKEELARRHAIQLEQIKHNNAIELKKLEQEQTLERIKLQKSIAKFQNWMSVLVLAGANFNQDALMINGALGRTMVNTFNKMR